MTGKPIVVLGMHRSGTSAVSGVLQRLGVEFGENLMPPMADVNEKGFYEHLDIVNLHEELLAHLGYRWFDVRPLPDGWWCDEAIGQFRSRLIDIIRRDFGDSPVWGAKDPRLCRLLPLWLDIFSELGCEPRFVLITRDPMEVVESLVRRDGLDVTGAYIAWLWHVFESERWTRGQRRVFVLYRRMLEDWRAVAGKVAEGLGIVWPVSLETAEKDVAGFLDPGLWHCHADQSSSVRGVTALAQGLFARLEHDDMTQFDSVWTSFHAEIERLAPYLESINQVQALRESHTHTLAALRAEKENARAQIEYRDALLEQTRAQIESIIAEHRKITRSRKALLRLLFKTFLKEKT